MGKTDKPEKTTKKQKHFWKDFKAELKKVIWPTKTQIVNNTVVVIIMVLIVTAIVFVLDLVFEALNTYGIDKLKTLVQNTVQTETVEEGNEQETEGTDEGSTEGENTNTEGEDTSAENTEGETDTTNEADVTDTANVVEEENVTE